MLTIAHTFFVGVPAFVLGLSLVFYGILKLNNTKRAGVIAFLIFIFLGVLAASIIFLTSSFMFVII